MLAQVRKESGTRQSMELQMRLAITSEVMIGEVAAL